MILLLQAWKEEEKHKNSLIIYWLIASGILEVGFSSFYANLTEGSSCIKYLTDKWGSGTGPRWICYSKRQECDAKIILKYWGFFVYKYEFSPIFSPPEGLPLHSWVLGKKGALTPTTPSDSPESTAIEVEDIPALLRDVARFAEAVEKLKDVVMTEGMVVTVILYFLWGILSKPQ